MYGGPAALVYAACSDRCANAKFETDGVDAWKVVVRKCIPAGRQVLVCYPAQHGVCLCMAVGADPRT
jgi:hypothetical protein